jgi:hypothetical protein
VATTSYVHTFYDVTTPKDKFQIDLENEYGIRKVKEIRLAIDPTWVLDKQGVDRKEVSWKVESVHISKRKHMPGNTETADFYCNPSPLENDGNGCLLTSTRPHADFARHSGRRDATHIIRVNTANHSKARCAFSDRNSHLGCIEFHAFALLEALPCVWTMEFISAVHSSYQLTL